MFAKPSTDRIDDVRSTAAEYEAALEPLRRKRLGQFFTGLPLGRLLAALALDPSAKEVLDPMAGHGDLLDAVLERADRRDQAFTRVAGVEIDPPTAAAGHARLAAWRDKHSLGDPSVRTGDAFEGDLLAQCATEGYDLVITNPPYVRYQTLATQTDDIGNRSPNEIRRDLLDSVQSCVGGDERTVWKALARGYSGLADLSVPAWILAGALVRPGGVLALVAPATWRTRNYGDTIEYLLARCFRVEYLVEDTQPGWFSDALVRTQLVVARRLPADEVRVPLAERPRDVRFIVTARVSPEARGSDSLVSASFCGSDPEGAFAQWMQRAASGGTERPSGVSWEARPVWEHAQTVAISFRARKWFSSVEPHGRTGVLFGMPTTDKHAIPVPPAICAVVGHQSELRLQLPEDAGIAISQGLRTGCNGFFYVDLIEELADEGVRIRLGELFGSDKIVVPAGCLRPVLRRQSEYSGRLCAVDLVGRALDLSGWVLPEDTDAVERSEHLYAREGLPIPRVMPPELAEFVRRAAQTTYTDGPGARQIPALSAVKTNVRLASGRAPRFWYMLPPFVRRHLPDAFVPRINQSQPLVDENDSPPVLVDANFSTLWGDLPPWPGPALRALFNSSWSRACMEALGTPLGGGALKLEATQLKQLPVPLFSKEDIGWLARAGRTLQDGGATDSKSIDAFMIERLFGRKDVPRPVASINNDLREVARDLCSSRQRRLP